MALTIKDTLHTVRLKETGFHKETLPNPCPTCTSLPMCRQTAKVERTQIKPGSTTCQQIATSEEQSEKK